MNRNVFSRYFAHFEKLKEEGRLKKSDTKLGMKGQILLHRGDESLLTEPRFLLLEKIAETGSITKAGRAAGISYRTAWLTVDRINAASDRPVVERTAGGKSGGGTRLTPYGLRLLEAYRSLREDHARYLARRGAEVADLDRFLDLARRLSLRTSARNQFFGKVESAAKEGLEARVILRLAGGERIASRITWEGWESLGLAVGGDAYALIKANWVSLRAPGRAAPAPEANRLAGRVAELKRGKDRFEAAVSLKGGARLVASLPGPEAKALGLAEGSEVVAEFRESDVILGAAG